MSKAFPRWFVNKNDGEIIRFDSSEGGTYQNGQYAGMKTGWKLTAVELRSSWRELTSSEALEIRNKEKGGE